MSQASTPHINPQGVPIAETVLMPGDPLRAQFIAETYLENPVQFNSVRNMLGFTGTYQGNLVSVMGSGMGNAIDIDIRLGTHSCFWRKEADSCRFMRVTAAKS